MNDQTTPTDRQILAMESRTFRFAGSKDQAIADELGITAIRYAQLLHRIVMAPDLELAVDYGPLLNRLRRKVEQGRRAKAARRAA